MKHNGTSLLRQVLWPRDLWLAALCLYLALGLSISGAILSAVLPSPTATEITDILAAIVLHGLLGLICLYLIASLFVLIYDSLIVGLHTIEDAVHTLRVQQGHPRQRTLLILAILAHPALLLLFAQHPLIRWALPLCTLGYLFYALPERRHEGQP